MIRRRGRSYKKILDKIKERYNEIIDGLDLNLNLDHEFDKCEENFPTKAGEDYTLLPRQIPKWYRYGKLSGI